MKIWNFGIIGAGLIADFHAKAIQNIKNARLIGFCSTNPEKVRNLADKYNCKIFNNYAEMLHSDEIEIVTIATPSGAHMEPTIEAARCGKHVICEKPLEISLERVDKMIEAHDKAGTKLGGIFNYRYNDSFKYLKSAIDDGRFGTITYASIHVPWWRSDDYYKDSWHGTLKLDGGGALMNQAIHMIDILQYLMGPVESLQAYTATLGHSIEVEDTAVAVLKFKNSALGVIYGSTASFPGQFRRIEITGTKGTVIQVENSFKVWQFADQTEADNEMLNKFNLIEGGGGISDPGAIPFEPHMKNIAAFIDSIETGKTFEINGTEAMKAVEIVLAIYTSAKENRPLKF
ncbi:MAG TPA: Gfo/Idh/MocA family oxidoreductase [Prolixibacteraceae bacterium]|nr:Gfo/Idh/MocA family oxidoreductase [Prolixibacteraceae bacterium]